MSFSINVFSSRIVEILAAAKAKLPHREAGVYLSGQTLSVLYTLGMKSNLFFIALSLILMPTWLFIITSRKSSPNSQSLISIVSVPIDVSSSIEIVGQISSIYTNPAKLLIAANGGNTYMLVINSSTEIIRDVGGTMGGTFTFGSLHLGDIVVARGSANSDGTVTVGLVEQTNSQGID